MKRTSWLIVIAAVILALWLLRQCRAPEEKTSPPPEVVFIAPENVAVARDYNQRVLVGVKNNGPGMALLRLRSGTFPDMPSGFVGRGTEDWEVPGTVLEIPPGEVWQAPLLVHANAARQDEYQVTLSALHQGVVAGEGVLSVRLAKPKLEIEATWLEVEHPLDRARLRRVLRLRNIGAPVADLSLHFEREGKSADHDMHWQPVVERTRLAESESMDVMTGPRLYPGFEKLAGELVIRGLNQEIRLPYQTGVPEGKAVFVTLSRTTGFASNNGNRCTNQSESTYNMPPVHGTPSPSGGGGGFSSGSTGGGGGRSVAAAPAVAPKTGDDAPKDEDKEDEDDDGFGFLGIDLPAGGGADKDAPEVVEESSETKEGKKKKADAKDEESKKKIVEVADATGSVPDGDFAASLLTRLNDGIMANLDSNARAGACGTLEAMLTDHANPLLPMRTLLALNETPSPSEPAPDKAGDDKKDKEKEDEKDEEKKSKSDASSDASKGSKPSRPSSVASRVDRGKPRTHMVRRPLKDGAEFIDFGFGFGGTVWRRNSTRTSGPISQPRLGPSPVKDGPALAAYTRPDKNGGSVAELLDPASGRAIPLSPAGKKSDSPVTVLNDGGVDAIHREDGVLKRTRLGENLALNRAEGWPSGEKTGPILAAETRADGKAALLTREDAGRIMLRQPEGVREFRGKAAALAFAGRESLVALQGEDGSISVLDAATGETRHTVPGTGHGAPSLITREDGGVRLSYMRPVPAADPGAGGHEAGGHFAAEYKDGRWSAPTRLFTPEAPVENAAVAVEFTPPFASAHYKPMDIGFEVNGRKVAEVKGRTPSGRYLYRAPVESLNYQNGPPPDDKPPSPNAVTVRSRGIGPGNFHIAQKCAMYSKHDWLQDCLVAADPAEADTLARLGTTDVRHNVVDLVLASNGTELPRSLQPGQETPVRIGVFNAGDLPSKPAGPKALGNDSEVGGADIPALAPFTGTQAVVQLKAPAGWLPGAPLKLSVSINHEGDADPSTNQLDFYLFRELDKAIAGPEAASALDLASLPPGSLIEASAGSKEQPFESALSPARRWFRVPIPESGDLQIEVNGPDASLVDRLDLFDTEGRALHPDSDRWSARGSHLHLRVGLPDGAGLSADTRLRLWWE